METNFTNLMARYAGRPVLMEPRALASYAARLREIDARAFERPGRAQALLRKIATIGRSQPLAMDDDDAPEPVPMDQRLAYAPRYIGEPDDTGFCWSLKNGIALIQINTPIMEEGEDYCGVVYHGYDTLLAAMSEAKADDRVKATFIKMNTPGGVAAPGLTALTTWMRANREAAGGKPIWVYAAMMCSAGTWVGSQGDKIVAAPMGYVGSVGAYTLHEDDTGYLEKVGIKLTEIKFGAKKTDGAPWKALSDSAKADIQAEIDQLGNNFLNDMVLGRPQMTREGLIATEAAAFFAQADDDARSGLALGFVDEIMTEEEAFASLLAHVSSPALPNLVAIAGGAAKAETPKEQPMAEAADEKAAKLAALKTELKGLKADPVANAARITTIKTEMKALGDDGEDEDEDSEDKPDGQPKPKDDDEEEGEDEAAKISASAEAQSHPHLALAAIETKQTFAQFQATVKAQANAPKSRGALAEAFASAPRLGPDASKESGGAGSALVANAKKRGGAQ